MTYFAALKACHQQKKVILTPLKLLHFCFAIFEISTSINVGDKAFVFLLIPNDLKLEALHSMQFMYFMNKIYFHDVEIVQME